MQCLMPTLKQIKTSNMQVEQTSEEVGRENKAKVKATESSGALWSKEHMLIMPG